MKHPRCGNLVLSLASIAFALLTSIPVCSVNAEVVNNWSIESDRVAEYHKRNYSWPPNPDEYRPNTPGWKRLMQRRIEQLERVDNPQDRYNIFLSMVHSALMSPNFTQNGWGLTRAPQGLVDALLESLHKGLESDDIPEEKGASNVESVHRPSFIHDSTQQKLNARVLQELKPLHEAWSGVELTGQQAYGLRIYHNESVLHMHVDNPFTHIISSILHVDHDPDSEPWPIIIEDYEGNTNEVVLESGDMLLYESSKCFHGRPRPFNGTWYSSIFTHYYPKNWDGVAVQAENHYRIPPNWRDVKDPMEGLDELGVVVTSIKEPNCKDSWCAMNDTVKLAGPAEVFGKVLSANGLESALDVSFSDEL